MLVESLSKCSWNGCPSARGIPNYAGWNGIGLFIGALLLMALGVALRLARLQPLGGRGFSHTSGDGASGEPRYTGASARSGKGNRHAPRPPPPAEFSLLRRCSF
ncbi:hypothetical protein DND90_17585 [Pseudomonas syringae pv. maculicola]|nr:hypothetical protein DND90_17585 [Pseudomonas syringae pv. maculicola]